MSTGRFSEDNSPSSTPSLTSASSSPYSNSRAVSEELASNDSSPRIKPGVREPTHEVKSPSVELQAYEAQLRRLHSMTDHLQQQILELQAYLPILLATQEENKQLKLRVAELEEQLRQVQTSMMSQLTLTPEQHYRLELDTLKIKHLIAEEFLEMLPPPALPLDQPQIALAISNPQPLELPPSQSILSVAVVAEISLLRPKPNRRSTYPFCSSEKLNPLHLFANSSSAPPQVDVDPASPSSAKPPSQLKQNLPTAASS